MMLPQRIFLAFLLSFLGRTHSTDNETDFSLDPGDRVAFLLKQCRSSHWQCNTECRTPLEHSYACSTEQAMCLGVPVDYAHVRMNASISPSFWNAVLHIPKCWKRVAPLLCQSVYRPCGHVEFESNQMYTRILPASDCARLSEDCPEHLINLLIKDNICDRFEFRGLFSNKCERRLENPSFPMWSRCPSPLVHIPEGQFHVEDPFIEECRVPCRSPFVSDFAYKFYPLVKGVLLLLIITALFVPSYPLTCAHNFDAPIEDHLALRATCFCTCYVAFLVLSSFSTVSQWNDCDGTGSYRVIAAVRGPLEWCTVSSFLSHFLLLCANFHLLAAVWFTCFRKEDTNDDSTLKCWLSIGISAICILVTAVSGQWILPENDGMSGVCAPGLSSTTSYLFIIAPIVTAGFCTFLNVTRRKSARSSLLSGVLVFKRSERRQELEEIPLQENAPSISQFTFVRKEITLFVVAGWILWLVASIVIHLLFLDNWATKEKELIVQVTSCTLQSISRNSTNAFVGPHHSEVWSYGFGRSEIPPECLAGTNSDQRLIAVLLVFGLLPVIPFIILFMPIATAVLQKLRSPETPHTFTKSAEPFEHTGSPCVEMVTLRNEECHGDIPECPVNKYPLHSMDHKIPLEMHADREIQTQLNPYERTTQVGEREVQHRILTRAVELTPAVYLLKPMEPYRHHFEHLPGDDVEAWPVWYDLYTMRPLIRLYNGSFVFLSDIPNLIPFEHSTLFSLRIQCIRAPFRAAVPLPDNPLHQVLPMQVVFSPQALDLRDNIQSQPAAFYPVPGAETVMLPEDSLRELQRQLIEFQAAQQACPSASGAEVPSTAPSEVKDDGEETSEEGSQEESQDSTPDEDEDGMVDELTQQEVVTCLKAALQDIAVGERQDGDLARRLLSRLGQDGSIDVNQVLSDLHAQQAPNAVDDFFVEYPVVSRLSQAELRSYVQVLRGIAPQPLQRLEIFYMLNLSDLMWDWRERQIIGGDQIYSVDDLRNLFGEEPPVPANTDREDFRMSMGRRAYALATEMGLLHSRRADAADPLYVPRRFRPLSGLLGADGLEAARRGDLSVIRNALQQLHPGVVDVMRDQQNMNGILLRYYRDFLDAQVATLRGRPLRDDARVQHQARPGEQEENEAAYESGIDSEEEGE